MKRCSACGRSYRGRGTRIYVSRDGGAEVHRVTACAACAGRTVSILVFTPRMSQKALSNAVYERDGLRREVNEAHEREEALLLGTKELGRQLEELKRDFATAERLNGQELEARGKRIAELKRELDTAKREDREAAVSAGNRIRELEEQLIKTQDLLGDLKTLAVLKGVPEAERQKRIAAFLSELRPAELEAAFLAIGAVRPSRRRKATRKEADHAE